MSSLRESFFFVRGKVGRIKFFCGVFTASTTLSQLGFATKLTIMENEKILWHINLRASQTTPLYVHPLPVPPINLFASRLLRSTLSKKVPVLAEIDFGCRMCENFLNSCLKFALSKQHFRNARIFGRKPETMGSSSNFSSIGNYVLGPV